MSAELVALYLRLSWGNRLRGSLRRMKKPTYLLGALVFGAYIAWMGFGLLGARLTGGSAAEASPGPGGWIFAGIFAWLAGAQLHAAGKDVGLPLKKELLLFLVRAPLSRRQVLAFWMLHQVPGLLATSLIFGTMAYGFGGGGVLPAYLSTLVLLLLLNALMLGARQFASWVQERRLPSPLKRLPFGLFLGVPAVAAALAFEPRAGRGWVEWILAWAQREPLVATLAPAHAALGALKAPGLAEAALPMLAMLAVAGGLSGLALLRPQPFEEASLKTAERLELLRSRGLGGLRMLRERERRKKKGAEARTLPFELAPTGSPAGALVWRALLSVDRRPLGRRVGLDLLGWGGLGLLGGVLSAGQVWSPAVPVMAAYAGLMLWMVQQQQNRVGLSRDVVDLATLRTLPLTSGQLLRGEAAASFAAGLLRALGPCAAVVAGFAGYPTGDAWVPLTPGQRALLALGLPLLAVGASAAWAAVDTATAALWPAWVRWRPPSGVGLNRAGQGLLGTLVLASGMGLLLGPPTALLTVASVILAGTLGLGLWIVLPAAALWAAAIVGEGLLLLRLVEGRFGRLEPLGVE